MIKSIPLPSKQIALIHASQLAVNQAQRDLQVVTQTIMAGLKTDGQILSVDTTNNLLNIEVPDEKPDLKVEA